MNDEREIKFIYSEKFDEKVFNRILELMKELIISIQEEKMNKEQEINEGANCLSLIHISIVSTLYTPTSNADLMQALAKTLNVMRGTAESTRNYIEQQRVEQGIENAEETIKRLDRTGESVGRFSCIVLAFGTSKEEFQKSCSRVESKISALNLRVKILSNLQKEGFMSAFPTYTPVSYTHLI